MDLATAVNTYQAGERAKTGLIMASQLCTALTGFVPEERAGGRKMLLMMMESLRTEILMFQKSTGLSDFQRSVNALNEAISLVESDQPDKASKNIAAAVSAATTAAQKGWNALSEHGVR
jgi:hypothetical protein